MLAPVVQTLDSAIHWITQLVLLVFIRWIVIYPVDSAIHRLNNWGLVEKEETPGKRVTLPAESTSATVCKKKKVDYLILPESRGPRAGVPMTTVLPHALIVSLHLS